MSGASQPWGLCNCISLRVQQAAQDKGHSVSVLQYKGRANPKESQKTEKKGVSNRQVVIGLVERHFTVIHILYNLLNFISRDLFVCSCSIIS